MKSFNINSTVKVKLTEYGKQMLEKDWNEFWDSIGRLEQFPYTPSTTDENGYTEFQFWMLMQDLGKYYSLGGKNPFETEILINENDLRNQNYY